MSDRDRDYVEFVETVEASLRRTAYLMVGGDLQRVDDVVQDALYKLYLAWARIERAGNPVAYARRIVVNEALDLRRRWRREVPTETMPDPGHGDVAGDHAARDEIFAALAALPPRQRACVVLRYYEDLSIEQTAELLGCSEGTVKSQSARGLETLRHAMNRSRVVTGDSQ